jgi:hypothetical protein
VIFARAIIGAAVAILYYIVGGLIGISASPSDQAAAKGIIVVGIVFGLLITFAWKDERAVLAAVAIHLLLLGWCAVQ